MKQSHNSVDSYHAPEPVYPPLDDIPQNSPKRILHYFERTQNNYVLTIIVLILTFIVALVCCATAASVITQSSQWTHLHPFGSAISLESARYFNFGLDMIARVIAIVLGIAATYTTIYVATALSFERQGVTVQDALELNMPKTSFISPWTCMQLRVPWPLRTWVIISVILGLIAHLTSSLIFGYEALSVNQTTSQNVQFSDYDKVLGSNTSGNYLAPDYVEISSINPPPLFTESLIQTMISLDTTLLDLNATLPVFEMLAESDGDLQARNISAVLQGETVSTSLVECRPLSAQDSSSIDFPDSPATTFDIELTIGDGEQKVSMSEPIQISTLSPGGVRSPTYVFVMQTSGPYLPRDALPSIRSQVAIILVERGNCSNGMILTPFGDIIPGVTNKLSSGDASAPTDISTPFTIAGLLCNTQRTRTKYDHSVNSIKNETYFSYPIFGKSLARYSYSPIEGQPGLGGMGAMLHQHVYPGKNWSIPQCTSSDPSSKWSIDQSEQWSQAVQLVEIYESSLLRSATRTRQITRQVDVLQPMFKYQIAILPAALLVFGASMGAAGCFLLYLLVFCAYMPREHHALDVLRVVDELNRYSAIGERMPKASEYEMPPKVLKATLGEIRLRRRTDETM